MWLSEIFYGVGSSMVEPWIVVPVVAGSSPVLHPKQIPQWRNWKTHFFQKKDVEGSNPSWGTNWVFNSMDRIPCSDRGYTGSIPVGPAQTS